MMLQKPSSMDVHKKASLLPAIEVAHPGASYNPSFVDHQVNVTYMQSVDTYVNILETIIIFKCSDMMSDHANF